MQSSVLAIAEIYSTELNRMGLFNCLEGAFVSLPLTALASSLDVVDGTPLYRRPQLHLQIRSGYKLARSRMRAEAGDITHA